MVVLDLGGVRGKSNVYLTNHSDTKFIFRATLQSLYSPFLRMLWNVNSMNSMKTMEYLKGPISVTSIIQIPIPFLKIEAIIIVRMTFFQLYAEGVVIVHDSL